MSYLPFTILVATFALGVLALIVLMIRGGA